MKTKKHRFAITVTTYGTRRSAELELLVAFSQRKPDNLQIKLHKTKPKQNGAVLTGK